MKYILVGILLVIIQNISAQVKQVRRDDCGTPAPFEPYQLEKKALNRPLATLPYIIKVLVHVCADDDGTNVAANKADILRQLQNMSSYFAPHNICFILSGIEQINSLDLNNHNTETEKDELGPYLVANHLNIFIHNRLMDNTGGLNGNAYGIPNWYLSMVGTAISSTTNNSTMAHEMGHDFGLYHTFERFLNNAGMATKSENVPRSGACSNCTDNGDLICDTEADRDEGVDDLCNYTGSLRDACNNLFTPNTRNIMTYGNRACRDFFTAGQGGKARNAIDGSSTLTNAIAPDNQPVFAAIITAGRQFILARNTITINVSSFRVEGIARMNICARSVRLKPGVKLAPLANGFTSIRPNTLCQ